MISKQAISALDVPRKSSTQALRWVPPQLGPAGTFLIPASAHQPGRMLGIRPTRQRRQVTVEGSFGLTPAGVGCAEAHGVATAVNHQGVTTLDTPLAAGVQGLERVRPGAGLAAAAALVGRIDIARALAGIAPIAADVVTGGSGSWGPRSRR